MMGRPYAEVIAGVPKRMLCEEDALFLEFEAKSTGGETIIWVPPDWEVQLRIEADDLSGIMNSRDEDGRVHVICPAGSGLCKVTVSWDSQFSWLPK